MTISSLMDHGPRDNLHLGLRWVLNWEILPVPPLTPGAEIVSDIRIAEKAQGEICMRRAIGALAVRNDFLVRSDVLFLVHGLQLVRGFEKPFRIQVVGPFEVHGARNR